MAKGFEYTKKGFQSLAFTAITVSYGARSTYTNNGLLSLNKSGASNVNNFENYLLYTAGFGKTGINEHFFSGLEEIATANLSDPTRFGEYQYPFKDSPSEYLGSQTSLNGRRASRDWGANSSMNIPLPKKVSLYISGSIKHRIEWGEKFDENFAGFREFMHSEIMRTTGFDSTEAFDSLRDVGIAFFGDTVISFPDISYQFRISNFLPYWQYVPVLGLISKTADMNLNGNYKRTGTRPFDLFNYETHYNIKHNLKFRTKPDRVWIKDWQFSNTYQWDMTWGFGLTPVQAKRKFFWEDSISAVKSITAKKPWKILKWTIQLDNQLKVRFGFKVREEFEHRGSFKGIPLDPNVGETIQISDDSINVIWNKRAGYSELKSEVFEKFTRRNKDKTWLSTSSDKEMGVSTGFDYQFSRKINGGADASYKRETHRNITHNNISLRMFVRIRF